MRIGIGCEMEYMANTKAYYGPEERMFILSSLIHRHQNIAFHCRKYICK